MTTHQRETRGDWYEPPTGPIPVVLDLDGAIPRQRSRHGARPHPPIAPRRISRSSLVLVGLVALLVLGVAVAIGSRWSGAPAPSAAAQPTVVQAPRSTAPRATAAPPAAAAPQVYEGGVGREVVLDVPVGVAVVAFECARCRGPVALSTGLEPMIEATGPYTGRLLVGLRGTTTTRLIVTAAGGWRLTVGWLEVATRYDGPVPASGTGDDVLLWSNPPAALDLEHPGAGPFTAQTFATDRSVDVLAEAAGPYTGTVTLPADPRGAALIQIDSDGAWTATPAP